LLTGVKLLEKGGQREPEKDLVLSLLRKETLRLKEKLSEFLAYARPSKPNLTSGLVGELLQETVTQLQQDSELTKKMKITYEPAAEEEPCYFDRAKMKEVILNLGINSLQALEDKGTLRLNSFQSHGLQWIQITDNGPGIPAENLDHIFKPFFTSKREGTGLGLAIALRIVEEHGGEIRVSSVPDRETTFTVSWPLTGRAESVK
jgi:signal transduction histidine kinase